MEVDNVQVLEVSMDNLRPMTQSQSAASGAEINVYSIRLPSGNTIKKRFPADATMEEVFTFVKTDARAEDRTACSGVFQLLQAFPRRVFGTDDQSLTIRAAGLVPSGSLNVLKSKVEEPITSPTPNESAPVPMDTDETPNPTPPPPRQQVPLNHRWGQGRRMMDEDPAPADTAGSVPNQNAGDQPEDAEEAASSSDSDESRGDEEGPDMRLQGGQRLGGGDSSGGSRLTSGQGMMNRQDVTSPQSTMPGGRDRTRTQADKPMRSVKALRAICLRDVAAMMAKPQTPKHYLTLLKYLPSDLGELLIKQLMSTKHFDRATVLRLRACPVQTLELDSYGLATDSLLETISTTHWASVTKLFLRGCEFITDGGVRSVGEMVRLKYLDLSSCRVTDRSAGAFGGLRELTYLNLSKTKITSRGLGTIVQSLQEGLEELIISSCPNIKGDDLFVLLQGITNLRTLNISGTPCATPLQPPSQTAFKALTDLDAARTAVGDEDMKRIVSGLSALGNLDLTGCLGVSERGLGWLTKGLKKVKCISFPGREMEVGDVLGALFGAMPLEKLDLNGYVNVTDRSIAYLSSLQSSLTYLSLAGTKITDEALPVIGVCAKLTQLYLDRTRITDVGLVPALSHLPNLELLSLSETRITDATLLSFRRADFARILRTLNLGRTDVTDVGVRGGVAFCVNLGTLNLDGTMCTVAGVEVALSGLEYLQPVRMARLRPPPED
ncbi:hypothetical protein HDV00_005209 [Rhizophlyctis rosea]|nr:hypothetical protein HDV00_005209 [Rhizophlyctis rosea]